MLTGVGFSFLLLWNLVGIYVRLKYMPWYKLSFFVSYLIIASCCCRIVNIIDPFGFYDVFSTVVVTVFNHLAIGFVLAFGILLIAIWFDAAINCEEIDEKEFSTAIIASSIGGGVVMVCTIVNTCLGVITGLINVFAIPLNVMGILTMLYVSYMNIFAIPKLSATKLIKNKRVKAVLVVVFVNGRLCGC